jgi:hypothetical protein
LIAQRITVTRLLACRCAKRKIKLAVIDWRNSASLTHLKNVFLQLNFLLSSATHGSIGFRLSRKTSLKMFAVQKPTVN